ncbi:hypothetical protein [Mesorhizobium sp. M0633]|uniref:hypothetical protein n=1 Tax=Mesorhizobium sp. M0633 TaxID=2956977 RepID=UPI00333A95E5
MSLGKKGMLVLIAMAFVAIYLGIVIKQKKSNTSASRPTEALEQFEGKLSIQAIDDLRVAGRKVLLCGVAFTKPRSMQAMATEVARRDYQGRSVKCKAVGTGTPCDGNIASKLGAAVVVQCFMPDGTDLAAKLIESGLLCGQPAQAGSTYRTC